MFQRERIQENFSRPALGCRRHGCPAISTGRIHCEYHAGPDSGKTGAGVIGEQDRAASRIMKGNVDDSTVQEVVIQQPQNSS